MISFNLQGIFQPANFNQFNQQFMQKIRDKTAEGMKEGGLEIKSILQAEASRKYKVKKKQFLSLFNTQLLYKDKRKNPYLNMGNIKVNPILIANEYGGRFKSRSGNQMFVQLTGSGKRLSEREFRRVLNNLFANNSAFVREVNGKKFIFAKSYKNGAGKQTLSNFKKNRREATGRRISKDQYFPIAMLLDEVEVIRKTNINAIIQQNFYRVVNKVQQKLNTI